MRSRSCACATGKCIRRCVVRVCMSDIPTCVRLPSEDGFNMCGSKCLYAFSESIFKPKLLAQHHVYAWFAGLPRKDGLISYRSERTRLHSTQQCDLLQSPLFLPDVQCFRADRMAQLQRPCREGVWDALVHTLGAAFQFRESGARAVSIALLVTFCGMVLAWTKPKIWRCPSCFLCQVWV